MDIAIAREMSAYDPKRTLIATKDQRRHLHRAPFTYRGLSQYDALSIAGRPMRGREFFGVLGGSAVFALLSILVLTLNV